MWFSPVGPWAGGNKQTAAVFSRTPALVQGTDQCSSFRLYTHAAACCWCPQHRKASPWFNWPATFFLVFSLSIWALAVDHSAQSLVSLCSGRVTLRNFAPFPTVFFFNFQLPIDPKIILRWINQCFWIRTLRAAYAWCCCSSWPLPAPRWRTGDWISQVVLFICHYCNCRILKLLNDLFIDDNYSLSAEPINRVKRIVTKSSLAAVKDRMAVVGASVERSNSLRSHLMSLISLLRKDGGFSNSASGRDATWKAHDIRLATHLVATFYMLKDNGFKPPPSSSNRKLAKGNSDDDRLLDFMAACFVLFSQDSGFVRMPDKTRTAPLTPEEEDDFLRELTALFFVLSSGGDVFKLLSSTMGGEDSIHQQQVEADFAAQLSQANGLKLPFKGRCLFAYSDLS